MSAAEIEKKIRDLQGILAGYHDSLREAKTDHDRSQYNKFIASTEREIAGLRLELKASYGR